MSGGVRADDVKAGTYFHNRFCTFVKCIQIEAKPVNGFASICVVSLTNLLKSITSTSLKLNIRGFQFRITGLAFIIK